MHFVLTGGLPKGGGSHSGVAHFFLFLLLAGIATIGFGVWWSQVEHEVLYARKCICSNAFGFLWQLDLHVTDSLKWHLAADRS